MEKQVIVKIVGKIKLIEIEHENEKINTQDVFVKNFVLCTHFCL